MEFASKRGGGWRTSDGPCPGQYSNRELSKYEF